MSVNKFLEESSSPSPEVKKGSIDVNNVSPDKYRVDLSVEELLNNYTTKHYQIDGKRTKVVFLRKSQRGNTFDSDFRIWSKDQALDVLYETAHKRQDLSLQLVEISKENVEFNKKKSGIDSPDYLIMKFIYDKEGDCLLGQDGQQTFTILNLLVRPFLPADLKFSYEETKFKNEITFQQENSEEGSVLSWDYPRKNQDSFVISDWPSHAKSNILSENVSLTIYTKVLFSHIPKIFENKNVKSSPNAAEIRTVSTNLVSWVSSYITATDDELKNRFMTHEKSMPLSVMRKKGKNPFVPINKEFGSNKGEQFNKFIGNNIRMGNEEFFQKILVCEDTKTQTDWADNASIVSAKHLNNLVKEEITDKNYESWKKRLLHTIDNFSIMFKMFEKHDQLSIKKLSKKIGFITDLNNIISYIKRDITDYKVSYVYDGQKVVEDKRVELMFKNYKKFISLFVKEWNKLVAAEVKKKKDMKLTDIEQERYDVIESTDSFQWKSIKRRSQYWEKWYNSQKDNFLKNDVLSVKDITRLFTTKEKILVAVTNDYTNPLGEKIDPIDVWNGKLYHTDHWDISYKNGGFTCVFNAHVLKAKTNILKSAQNAKEFIGQGVN